jgi:hypothetical protein
MDPGISGFQGLHWDGVPRDDFSAAADVHSPVQLAFGSLRVTLLRAE